MTIDDNLHASACWWVVLEVPHRGEPRAFVVRGREDFLRRNYAAAQRSSGCLFDRTTARQLASDSGVTPETVMDYVDEDSYLSEVAQLGETHGWDTPLYRADYARTSGLYDPEPIDEVEAVSAWAARDLSGWYLCRSEAEVHETLARLEGACAPRVGQCGPVRAAGALRRAACIQT